MQVSASEPEATRTPSNGAATASVLLGVLTIVLSFLPFIQVLVFVLAPASLVYAALGIRRAAATGIGGPTAAWGLVLGTVGLMIAVILVIALAQS
jgi:hypothetical protein